MLLAELSGVTYTGSLHSRYQNLSGSGKFFQIGSLGVAHHNGAIRVEQKQRHRLSDDIGSTKNNTALSRWINAVFLQHFHNAAGRTGLKDRLPNGQLSYIVWMEAIHILCGINSQQYTLLIKSLRQRKLHQNAVDGIAPVERIDQSQQFFLGGGRIEGVFLT